MRLNLTFKSTSFLLNISEVTIVSMFISESGILRCYPAISRKWSAGRGHGYVPLPLQKDFVHHGEIFNLELRLNDSTIDSPSAIELA